MGRIGVQQAAWREALDDDQQRAAEHDAGPLIVLAGPGTGKTRTLLGRIGRLLDQGAEPESIVGLTFSVKAADEMRSRLAQDIAPGVADRVTLSTFHAFGARMIARFGDMLGVPPSARLMDSGERRRLVRQVIRESRLFEDEAHKGEGGLIRETEQFIRQCKNSARSAQEAQEFGGVWRARVGRNEDGLEGEDLEATRYRAERFARLAEIYAQVDRRALQMGLLSFEDHLMLPIRALTEHEIVASLLRSELSHVLVDEFQDVNGAQIELLRRLAPPERNPDLCVVGDDDQAIYAFRGADAQAFARFATIWKEHTTIELGRNHRSTQRVVEATNHIIVQCIDRFAPDKQATSEADEALGSGIVEGVLVDQDGRIGTAIASMILADRKANPDRRWSDYGVLARTNAFADQISSELKLQGIEVWTRRGRAPLEDDGVKDLLAWMALVSDRNVEMSLRRLLLRPPLSLPVALIDQWRSELGHDRKGDTGSAQTIEWLAPHAPEHPMLADFLSIHEELLRHARMSTAHEFVRQLLRSVDAVHNEMLDPRDRALRVECVVALLRFVQAKQHALEQPGDLEAFWRHYDDLDDAEQALELIDDDRLDSSGDGDEAPDAVQVLTAHSAKGLEFDTVFVARARPGHGFPSSHRSRPWDIEDLPREFTHRESSVQDSEERRLFYVACTRAIRRLVLLGKRKKSRTPTIDYFDELRYDAHGLEMPVHEADELIESAGLTVPPDSELTDLHRGRKALRALEVQRARQDAYLALRDAQQPGATDEQMRDVSGRLEGIARRLASIASLARDGTLPDWAEGDDELQRLAARHLAGSAPAPVVRPIPGPIEISYSRVIDYESCPRCFYMKHVLGIAEDPSGPLGLGSLVHSALERFFGEVRRASAEGESVPSLERLESITTDAAQGPLANGTLDRTQLEQALAQVRIALESLHEPSTNILEIEHRIRFRYPCPLGRHEGGHGFTAKLDRIDQLADGSLRIVDYKTGYPAKSKTEPSKKDLQLAIYALALREYVGEGQLEEAPLRGRAEYWMLSSGQRGSIAISDLDLDDARKRIDQAIAGMLEGRFERSARKCRGLCELLPEIDGDSQ